VLKKDLENEFEKELKENYTSESNNAPVNSYKTETFRLVVEEVFSITGRGIIVIGKVERGSVSISDTVKILDSTGSEKQTSTVAGIETFRKQLTTATVGDNIGLLLRGADRNAVKRGDIIVK
jgi:elongation factor Tu